MMLEALEEAETQGFCLMATVNYVHAHAPYDDHHQFCR